MLTNERRFRLNQLRVQFEKGDAVSQPEIDCAVNEFAPFKNILRQNENDESCVLVDSRGEFTLKSAPRWACHLLGLRHTIVDILLLWNSPVLGPVFVFQVRGWNRPEAPGHVDISVAGHVAGREPMRSEDAAYREMNEELGLQKKDLIHTGLIHMTGYESYNEDPQRHFYNSEWREVFVAEVSTQGFNRIHFPDNEVVGLYLCPEKEINNFLSQKIIPIAQALRLSVPKCVENLRLLS